MPGGVIPLKYQSAYAGARHIGAMTVKVDNVIGLIFPAGLGYGLLQSGQSWWVAEVHA